MFRGMTFTERIGSPSAPLAMISSAPASPSAGATGAAGGAGAAFAAMAAREATHRLHTSASARPPRRRHDGHRGRSEGVLVGKSIERRSALSRTAEPFLRELGLSGQREPAHQALQRRLRVGRAAELLLAQRQLVEGG